MRIRSTRSFPTLCKDITLVMRLFSKSLAIGLPASRVGAYVRRSDSVRVYWTTLTGRDRNRGDPSSPFPYLWLLLSKRIKVIIIRKEIKVENKELQCFSLADVLICFLYHERS